MAPPKEIAANRSGPPSPSLDPRGRDPGDGPADNAHSGGDVYSGADAPAAGLSRASLVPNLAASLLTLERHFRTLDSVRDPADRQRVWENLLRFLRQAGVRIPETGMDTYEDFLASLRPHGDLLADRVLSLRAALALRENAERLADPDRARGLGEDRPLLVFVCAEADYNGALSARRGFNTLENLVRENRCDVLYVEAGSDAEAERAVAEIHERTGHRIRTLMMAGHGTAHSILLSDPLSPREGAVSADGAVINPADFDRGGWAGLDLWMEEEGQIVLISCSTGAPIPNTAGIAQGNPGTFPGVNMAGLFTRAAPGRRVDAPRSETRVPSLKYDETTRAYRVEWNYL